eukprot:m51a1_g8117 hypothetical protein (467) ;mRNA; f:142722-146311
MKEYYVRGDNGEMWIMHTVKVEGRTASVKWFEELRRFPDHYLQAAWQLRTLVLPRVACADLEPLALAFPSALLPACCSLCPALLASSAALARLFLAACAPRGRSPASCAALARWWPARRSAAARAHGACELPPASALLLAVCAAQSRCPRIAAAAAALVVDGVGRYALRGSAALVQMLGALQTGSPEAIAAAVDAVARGAENGAALLDAACRAGSPEALDVLGSAPFTLGVREALEVSALFTACCLGHAGVVRRLAQPPFSLQGAYDQWEGCRALQAAAASGHAEVVRVLGLPPYSLGEADHSLLVPVFHTACASNLADVVQVLAEPPYSLAAESYRAEQGLERACATGSAGVVRVLGKYLGGCPTQCLRSACGCGSVEVVRLLSEPPFNMGHAQAADYCLGSACSSGNAELLRLLSEPPYSLGHEDAVKGCLLQAYHSGNAEVVRLLSEPPFSLGHAEAIADNFT